MSTRRWATSVLDLAARVLPAHRADWAEAMRQELPHIDGNGPALRWAVGCLFASCRERAQAKGGDIADVGPLARFVIIVVASATEFFAFAAGIFIGHCAYHARNIVHGPAATAASALLGCAASTMESAALLWILTTWILPNASRRLGKAGLVLAYMAGLIFAVSSANLAFRIAVVGLALGSAVVQRLVRGNAGAASG